MLWHSSLPLRIKEKPLSFLESQLMGCLRNLIPNLSNSKSSAEIKGVTEKNVRIQKDVKWTVFISANILLVFKLFWNLWSGGDGCSLSGPGEVSMKVYRRLRGAFLFWWLCFCPMTVILYILKNLKEQYYNCSVNTVKHLRYRGGLGLVI